MKFYRYQPINKLSISNLAKGKNWVANPFEFNDPFEFRMTDIYYMNKEGVLAYLDEDSMKARIMYQNTIEKFGVICYSTIEPSTLMYSHYADNHRGMCLEFEVLPENLIGMKEVKYKDRLDEFNFTLDKTLLKEEIIKICTTKSKVWQYEKEYRQLFTDKHFYADYPGKLTGITFGCKASRDDIELVLSVLNSKVKDLKISKTFIQKNTYLLGISTVPAREDGTFEVPQFWDGIHEA
jgi:hypothetical protein